MEEEQHNLELWKKSTDHKVELSRIWQWLDLVGAAGSCVRSRENGSGSGYGWTWGKEGTERSCNEVLQVVAWPA